MSNNIQWAERGCAAAVADHVAGVIARGNSVIAVPGGKTPVPILATLARRDLPWHEAELMLTDDRLVPHDHPASNYGLLAGALAGTGIRLTPLDEGQVPPHFDLVWLGMGEDGHVASIFPNEADRLGSGRSVVRTRPDPLPPEAPFERLTMTLPSLTASEDIILVVRGERKRKLIEQAMAGGSDLPITRLLKAATGPLTIYWSEQ